MTHKTLGTLIVGSLLALLSHAGAADAQASKVYACINTTTSALQVKAADAPCPTGPWKAVELRIEDSEPPLTMSGGVDQCNVTDPYEGTNYPVWAGSKYTNRDYRRVQLLGRWSCYDFSGSNFNGMYTDAELDNTNFSNAKMRNAIFVGSNFNTNFTNADLTGAQFLVPLNGAKFDNANLTNVRFTSFALQGATFAGANLTGVTWGRCVSKRPDCANRSFNLYWQPASVTGA